MQASQLISEVIVKDSASAVADRISGALDRLTTAEGKTQEGAVTSSKAIESSAKQFERLRATADPAYASQQRFANYQQQLARAVQLGTASEREAALVTQQLQAQLNGGTGSFGKYGMAVQNASFQVADFAVQVGAGTNPIRALAQQLPQLFGGFGVLGAAIGAVVAIGGALAPMFIAWASAQHGAALSTDELNKTLKEMDSLQKQISGNSERNKASIQAELNYRLSTVQATFDLIKKQQDATPQTITSQPRFSTQAVTTDNPAYKRVHDQLIQIQADLEKAKQDAGLFSDSFAKSGEEASDGLASTAKSLAEVIAARKEAIRVAELDRQEGDADKLVDQDLAALGIARAAASKDLIASLTQLAQTQVAATKAGKDAQDNDRKALENAKSVASALASLQKQYDDLSKASTDVRAEDLFAGKVPTAADLARAKELFALIDQKKFGQTQDKAFVSEIDQDIAELTRGAQEQSRWWEQSLTTQQNQVEVLQTQLGLVGANDNQVQLATAHLQAQQQVHAQIGNTMTENGRKFIENADKIAAMNQQLQKQRAIAQELPNFFDQAFDRIGSAITQATATGQIGFANLLDIGKAVVSELEQEFLKLALLNPLKNWINGDDALPSIFNLFSSGGGGGLFSGGGRVGFAAGGSVAGGVPILVGEQGPEIFTPPTNGSIIPNHALGLASNDNAGAPIVVNVTINASGGTQSQNADLAGQASKAVKQALDDAMDRRMREQSRKGGLLNPGIAV